MVVLKRAKFLVLLLAILPQIKCMHIQIGTSSRKGPRTSNEDTFCTTAFTWDGASRLGTPTITPKSNLPVIEFYAVFDGHKGASVAENLRENFLDYFLLNIPATLTPAAIDAALVKSFEIANNEIFSHKEWNTQGSTALVVIKIGNYLYIAHAGDSRAAVIKNNQLIALTKDHGLRTDEERERAKSWLISQQISVDELYFWGCWRIRELSLSSTVGDSDCEKYINRIPEITHYEINPTTDTFLILACDGVWEFFDKKEKKSEDDIIRVYA